MDDALYAALDTLHQRFRDLATQFRQNHAAWLEAVREDDLPRQSALIARERAILTDLREVITASNALIAQWLQEWGGRA
jgi:hypothetical protein